ncbi:MAG: hypothetical protein ABI091_19490, partial [Ferruginibacter sp.]
QFKNYKQTTKPRGLAISFWLHWIMNQTGQDASMMQVNTFRSPIIKKMVDFRRFEISIDQPALQKLKNIGTLNPKKYGTEWLHDVSPKTLNNIDLADTKKFDLMKVIGEQMAEYIITSGNNFQKDLINERENDQLVSFFGDTENIKEQMSDPSWIDKSLA